MQPNIVIFVTDQLTWNALPCYGNRYAKTPNIDALAQRGVRFEQCYTPCPICQPARASFWSSKWPHEIDVMSNGRQFPVRQVGEDVATLGETFHNAGYDAIHFGKTHDAGALRGFVCGAEEEIKRQHESGIFVNMDTFGDYDTTQKTTQFLENRNSDKPLLLVADYVNPHTICGWIGEHAGVHTDPPFDGELPELPDNFEFTDIENRPLPIQYICCSHNRQAQTAGWTPENFRHYLAAYYTYIEMVDEEIGHVMQTLEKTLDMENTLVVFMADHGDSMTARGRVTKQVDFYEEVSRVPFVFAGKNIPTRKESITGLASLLDLFPTLCDYAGIAIPEGLRGASLLQSLQTGQAVPRKHLMSQWHTEWGYTVSPGRMIVSDGLKYTKFIEDQGEELYDLVNDPLEQTNQAKNPAYADKLQEMRAYLAQTLQDTQDPFETMEYYAAPRWRSHALGYQNHKGDAAPMCPFSKV